MGTMENKLICPKCGKEFSTVQARCGHMASCKTGLIECEICHKSILRSFYEQHVESHKKDHPCLQCGNVLHGNKKFCNSSCAAKYNNAHRSRTKQCLNCGNTFHPKHAEQKFCCTECSGKFRSATRTEENLKKYLNGEITDQGTLKKCYIAHNEYKCSICGLTEWQNKPITLVLDHINGNPYDNRPENLRLVCPNCDIQLPTFGSKNRGNGRFARRKRYAENKSS